MLIKVTDFNGAEQEIAQKYPREWNELESVLSAMPLHLKASDQAKIQGRPIFDPVGTNQYVADQLVPMGWEKNIPIPADFTFLGTDVDFGKNGVVVEVQFSNYPFLLNNTVRSELFFRSETAFHKAPTGVVIIVTKAQMFPSSNSTLYYEQALNQLTALAEHEVFTVPIRLVGLFEEVGRTQAMWTEYSSARYSRTIGAREQRTFDITNGRAGRCRVEKVTTSGDL